MILLNLDIQQLIKKPTRILSDSSSYIDLIFTFHPSLVIELRVNPLFYSNCHHQTTFAKFSLKIHYPPPYKREIWHYRKINTDHIRQVIKQSAWSRQLI